MTRPNQKAQCSFNLPTEVPFFAWHFKGNSFLKDLDKSAVVVDQLVAVTVSVCQIWSGSCMLL